MKVATLLELRRVSKDFGGLRALDAVDLEVSDAHAFWGLIGPNGAGKTTLFNVVSGVYPPTEGRVVGPAVGAAAEGGGMTLGRTFQHPRVFPSLTVAENMLAVARGMSARQARERAIDLLDLVDLTGLAQRRAGELSIGQQKLVELVRSLMPRPQLVLLDEVAAGIHPRLTARIAEYLRVLADGGVRFLIIEHDMKFLMELCSRVFVLARGRLIAQGTPDDIRRDPRIAEIYLGTAHA
ncbi:MAG: ABC transporter ATP-binding protein [Egibacteraceae bacterium]